MGMAPAAREPCQMAELEQNLLLSNALINALSLPAMFPRAQAMRSPGFLSGCSTDEWILLWEAGFCFSAYIFPLLVLLSCLVIPPYF